MFTRIRDEGRKLDATSVRIGVYQRYTQYFPEGEKLGNKFKKWISGWTNRFVITRRLSFRAKSMNQYVVFRSCSVVIGETNFASRFVFRCARCDEIKLPKIVFYRSATYLFGIKLTNVPKTAPGQIEFAMTNNSRMKWEQNGKNHYTRGF